MTAIDTMKESRDSVHEPLTDAQISQDVALCASLHTTHITVDTPYDNPEYLGRWVSAVRKTGKSVWFRSAFNAWEGSYGAKATMSPDDYLAAIQAFILAHRDLFRPGDILDPCPEPENCPFWTRTSPQGDKWSWKDAPNPTTDAFNKFFVDVTNVSALALKRAGVHGVITTIRSTNGYIASRPQTLYSASVARMGAVTIDCYVGQEAAITPSASLSALKAEVNRVHDARKDVPLYLGEYGYSIKGLVGDAQQQSVLKPQFEWLATLPWLRGVNYWHGAGYPAPDRYNGSRIFDGTRGAWRPRPAARDLSGFFSRLLHRG